MGPGDVLCIRDKITGRLFAGKGNWNWLYVLCLVPGSAGLCVIVLTENSLDFKLLFQVKNIVRKS